MVNCLGCNTGYSFAFEQSKFFVCPTCKTVNQKYGTELLKMFVSAPLEEEMSPIQVGTKGTVEGKKFTVTGRARFIFADSYVNQWNLAFDGNMSAIMGEYCGSYAIYNTTPHNVLAKHLIDLNAGRVVSFNKNRYVLTNMLETERVECEGELFTLSPHVKFSHIEFAGDNKTMSIINIYTNTSFELLTGKYYEYKELNFTQARSVQEWE